MNRDLSDYRKSYEQQALSENTMPTHPVEFFEQWFKEVQSEGSIEEVNAMTLATVNSQAQPQARIVLLKSFSKEGFVFYTNYDSDKGRSMESNQAVSLSFFWPNLERQVIVLGTVSKVSPAVSDAYFASRPKGSQLGAWVSQQSQVIASFQQLQDRLEALKKEYENKPIIRPNHWGGYVVVPKSIEFWQGRPNRLHDRVRYRIENKNWIKERLSP